MLVLKDVSKHYNEIPILRHVEATFEANSFHFVCGKSGSGKSTLLKLINREIDLDYGEILWCETPIQSFKKYELRREIGVIFQSFELIPHMTVLENILLAGQVVGKDKNKLALRAKKLIERVGLKGKELFFPHQLSGGQMQRVAIVRALMNHPKLLLADEPTGNLDMETADEIIQLLYDLHQEEQITMIIVTHSVQLVKKFKSHLWYVKEGEMYEQSSHTVYPS